MAERFTAHERHLIELWERHMHYEFVARDPAATIATMSRDNSVLTGGNGPDELRAFYERHFIPKMPADTQFAESARKLLDPTALSNELIRRAEARRERAS
jgi:carboxymethylenebutenolidase